MISLINLTVDMIIEGISYTELMLIWKSTSDEDCAETNVRIILIIVCLIKHRLRLSIFRNKNVFIPQESSFVSCSYVWRGVTQSMHRITLRFWQNIYLFSIFSLRYIEHTIVFFSFSLASGLPRVIVCQLRSCHNKCFLWESNTFTP